MNKRVVFRIHLILPDSSIILDLGKRNGASIETSKNLGVAAPRFFYSIMQLRTAA